MRWFGSVVAVMVAFLFVGCAATLPSWGEARDEARGEMQAIVDMLPAGTVDRIEDPIPAGFVGCESGVMYTGRWMVYLGDPVNITSNLGDIRREIDRLGYVSHEGPIPNSDSSFAARTPTGLLVSVHEDTDQEETPYVEIISYARCSQAPDGVE